MPYFHNEGFRMHYEVHPGLVPLDCVFIHGNVASNRWWEPAVEAWAEHAVKVWPARARSGARPPGGLILAEWRGCGRSAGPSGEAELEPARLARDYIELIENLGLERVALVAHSSGAVIALEALRQAPARFSRAVLLDPLPARGGEVPDEIRLQFLEMSRHRDVLKAALRRTILDYPVDSPYFEKLVDDAFGAHPVVWSAMLKRIGGYDLRAALPEIRVPTLVLHGDQDRVLPVDGSLELAGALAEGRFQLLEGQGHSCQIENPARFVDLADRFLFG